MSTYRKGGGGPTGSALVARVRRDLERGWPPGLTVLSGNDAYHLDRARKVLLAGLVPEGGAADFGLTVFGDARVDVGTVIAAARSVGMFSPRRVVLVRDVTTLEGEPNPVVDYAAAPPAHSFVLVVAPALDRRRKLHQALAKSATLLDFRTPEDPSVLAGEVSEIGATKGLSLDGRVAMILAEACGGDLLRVESELEKIRTWRGSDGAVRMDDLSEIASRSGLLSGWEVADAVLRRDESDAILALRRTLDSGDEPLKILGGLAFRARAMLRAKALVESGVGMRDAFGAARLFGDSFERRAAGLRKYRMDELLRFPSMLSGADRTLKSRTIEPGAVLEDLVRRMTKTPA